MINFELTLAYDEYLEMADNEQRKIIDKLNEQGQLISNSNKEVLDINSKINVVVFSEPRCKDAATEIPILLKLAEKNKNITVRFLRREGNEELLERESGEKKVPTFLILNKNGEVERKYIEFPRGVKKILMKTPKEEVQSVIDRMRAGEYNVLIEEDIIRFLTNIDYDYLRYDKK